MKKKILIILTIFMLLFTSISVVSIAKESNIKKEKINLDPGGIKGPIFGRIEGYEATEAGSLILYTKRVHHFGIGFGICSGLYPRFYRNEEVMFNNFNFKGIVTQRLIFGIIEGLPN